MRFFWPMFWFFLVALVVYAWFSTRRRIKRSIEVSHPLIDADDIRRIEEVGSILTDDPEPLDLEQIGKEEDEFWKETWDEPGEL